MGRSAGLDGRQVNCPVELGSTIVFDTLDAFEKARDARYTSGTQFYGRYGNEASFQLETVISALEGAHGTTLTSPGVAAITSAFLAFVRPNSHPLIEANVSALVRGLQISRPFWTAHGPPQCLFNPLRLAWMSLSRQCQNK
jgi:cystathionine beta-lyase